MAGFANSARAWGYGCWNNYRKEDCLMSITSCKSLVAFLQERSIMRKCLSITSAATLLCAVPLAHGDVLFQENFESYAHGATSLSSAWTIGGTGTTAITGRVVDDGDAGNANDQAIEGDRYWQWSYPRNVGTGIPNSYIETMGWRQDPSPGVYTVSQRVYVAHNTSAVTDRTESDYFIFLEDENGNRGAGLTIQTTGDYAGSSTGRDIQYHGNGQYNVVADSLWPRDEWLMVVMTIDEINATWSFEVADEDGNPIAALSGLSYSSNVFTGFDKLKLHVQPGNQNRGVDVWIDDIQINGPIPEPGSMSLLGLGGAALLLRRRKA